MNNICKSMHSFSKPIKQDSEVTYNCKLCSMALIVNVKIIATYSWYIDKETKRIVWQLD